VTGAASGACQGGGVRTLTTLGLSEDGRTLLLRDGTETVAVPLEEIRLAVAPAVRAAAPDDEPAVEAAALPRPSPREIQQRIREGARSADIARRCGMPLAAVARYEGPPLAEREHQATRARRALVDGRAVERLVEEHFARMGADEPVEWDCWLVEPGKWELRARVGRASLRLRWDAQAARVRALDESGRSALRLGPAELDVLGAVLRPTAAVPGGRAPRPLHEVGRPERRPASVPPARS